jgi:beta-phosphoglucomutase-like phosphatase (HAD superfamily)
MKNYVFDLESTLFFTNRLNTLCYNEILKRLKLSPIEKERVTRSDLINLYPDLNEGQIDIIIKEKQKLFVENMNKISPNIKLISILKELSKNQCILWTHSDKKKARHILRYFNIEDKFRKIIDKTDNISLDIENIRVIFSCKPNEIEFYEDDRDIIEQLKKLGLIVIDIAF